MSSSPPRGTPLGWIATGSALLVFGAYVLGSLAPEPVIPPKASANPAKVWALKDSDIYLLSETLGEKKLTLNRDIKTLLDHRGNTLVYGRGWEGDTEALENRTGGMKLFSIKDDGTGEKAVTDDLATDAIVDAARERIFYTTESQDLYMVSQETGAKTKLQEKVLRPSVSPDGKFLVYMKLNADWQPGSYFDQALGITTLDLEIGEEKRIADTPNDFNPVWTPDGKKIVFFSASPEGNASHFIMNADGSDRKQLTNVGQKFVSENTVPIPSERVTWSPSGRAMAYESDRTTWVIMFDKNYEKVLTARRIGFGVYPQWSDDGHVSFLVTTGSRGKSVITVDLLGNTVR